MLQVQVECLLAAGLIPSDNGNIAADSGPPKAAVPEPAAISDVGALSTARPAAPTKPDPLQKVCLPDCQRNRQDNKNCQSNGLATRHSACCHTAIPLLPYALCMQL